MDWSKIYKGIRDANFEKEYCFDPKVDYSAEVDKYNELAKANDREAIRILIDKHNGIIPLFGKQAYQYWLKKAGVLF